jgi:DNA-binding LacI/PurR family transcriptional regulator
VGHPQIKPEVQARIVKEVIDNCRLMEDVSAQFNVSISTVSRFVARERAVRRERAAMERSMEALKSEPGSGAGAAEVAQLRSELVGAEKRIGELKSALDIVSELTGMIQEALKAYSD